MISSNGAGRSVIAILPVLHVALIVNTTVLCPICNRDVSLSEDLLCLYMHIHNHHGHNVPSLKAGRAKEPPQLSRRPIAPKS
jgi:hypothetical protein